MAKVDETIRCMGVVHASEFRCHVDSDADAPMGGPTLSTSEPRRFKYRRMSHFAKIPHTWYHVRSGTGAMQLAMIPMIHVQPVGNIPT